MKINKSKIEITEFFDLSIPKPIKHTLIPNMNLETVNYINNETLHANNYEVKLIRFSSYYHNYS